MITKRYVTPMLIALEMLQATPTQGGEVGYLPPTQTQNGITYVTGGFGVDESCAMKEAAGNYDLMLTFAERIGEVATRSEILDTKRGTLLRGVLAAACAGTAPATSNWGPMRPQWRSWRSWA